MLAHQSYDPIASFEPIAIICDSVAAIVVNASLPVSDLNELVAYARKNPGNLNYGSAGAGTVSNLAGELFKRLTDLPDITHIPYKGGGQAMSDLIAGQIPIMTPMMSENIMELHRRGRVRVLAIASDRRLAAAPDIATASEQGLPGLIARLFVGGRSSQKLRRRHAWLCRIRRSGRDSQPAALRHWPARMRPPLRPISTKTLPAGSLSWSNTI
jgi:tripartite-type tricarboxylate transporter receptor subunit TctC